MDSSHPISLLGMYPVQQISSCVVWQYGNSFALLHMLFPTLLRTVHLRAEKFIYEGPYLIVLCVVLVLALVSAVLAVRGVALVLVPVVALLLVLWVALGGIGAELELLLVVQRGHPEGGAGAGLAAGGPDRLHQQIRLVCGNRI